ncbi:hypothetical protein Tco_0744528 [Tanacetum coccineum]
MSANDNFFLHDDEELSLHDDASLNGSEPTSNKGDAPVKPPQIITTNILSNIKLPVLQKDDYDTWAMEMEHYLEYIDNEVWKVIQTVDGCNGLPKTIATKGTLHKIEHRSKPFIPPNQIIMSANDNFSLHDDEELSLHDDASLDGSVPASNKGDAPAKPPQIITTNTLSNIKLPVLQKDDYDTWADLLFCLG